MSYPGHLLEGGVLPLAEVQSVYSTAPTDWAIHIRCNIPTEACEVIYFHEMNTVKFNKQKKKKIARK